MSAVHDYYRILQVQPDAAAEVIRSSYRTLMQTLRVHPDLGGDPRQAALINEAYSVLSDPKRREAYDASRSAAVDTARAASTAHQAARCGFCAGPLPERTLRPDPGPWRCPTCRAPGVGTGSEQATGSGGQDARSILRIEHDAPVRFLSRWPQARSHHGKVLDLSPGGMRFQTGEILDAGTLLLLDCSVLDALGRVVDVQAREGQFEIRVAFEGVAVKQRQGGSVRTRA